MTNVQMKVTYLTNSLKKRFMLSKNDCPSCGCKKATILENKFLVTDLRRCNNCQLLFRTPITTEEENFQFYQKTYEQGLTTDLPTENQLQQWRNEDFINCPKNYNSYISLLKRLEISESAKVLDYGCSWGYGSFQLTKNGYDVTGFEISQPRCEYAQKKLNINAKSSLEEIQGQFDVIFSSHVIEHLPSVKQYLDWAVNHLVSGGFLITICPNGSLSYREVEPKKYNKSWGYYHPQLIDDVFYKNYFGKNRLFLSSELDNPALKTWNKKDFLQTSLSGSELLCIWVKN